MQQHWQHTLIVRERNRLTTFVRRWRWSMIARARRAALGQLELALPTNARRSSLRLTTRSQPASGIR